MLQNIFHFIKYHNAFTFMMAILIMGSGAFAASDELRSSIVSSQEKVVSADNAYLLSADLSSFNPLLQIKAITEDEGYYYVTYSYRTLGIDDYVWRETEKEDILKISKALLDMKKRDLGLYIAEELGEVASFNLSYLKEVQEKEKQNGETQKVATVQYAGLIGRFLEPEEKVFPGYEPIVKEIKPEPAPTTVTSDMGQVTNTPILLPNPVEAPTPVPAPQAPAPTISVTDLGSTPIPAQGITIYDRVTNQPKCIFVYNGGIGIADGLCAEGKDTNTNTNSPAITPVETPVSNLIPAPVENSTPPAASLPNPEVVPIAVSVPDAVPTATTTLIIAPAPEPVIVSTTTIETATTTP